MDYNAMFLQSASGFGWNCAQDNVGLLMSGTILYKLFQVFIIYVFNEVHVIASYACITKLAYCTLNGLGEQYHY
jgi:hypothetical protein